MSVRPVVDPEGDPLLAKARNLFEFLARAQEMKIARVRDVENYEHVLWLDDLPAHPAVSFDVSSGAAADRPVLTLERVALTDPPEPPVIVRDWLEPREAPDQEPTLRPIRRLPSGTTPDAAYDTEMHLTDHPEVTSGFDAWLPLWTAWAERDRAERKLHAVYRDLFSSYVKSSSKPDEYELVVGAVCLGWETPSGAVRRHLLVGSLHLELNETTGDLVATVEPAAGMRLETDMLDPGQIPQAFDIAAFATSANSFESHPLSVEEIGELGRRLVHSLGPDSRYDDRLGRPATEQQPRGTFAPAVILRRRSARGLVQLLTDIRAQLESAAEVPAGLRPLVDPDFRREVDRDPTPGAVIDLDGELFHALPVNDRQQQVISNVDSYAQTLVQGPPGTGKTHTAAALLTHLLGQGKRILVTAQTDRALKEVRSKLPEAIRPLAVSVVGASRADTADLKTAVETIASQAAEFDQRRAANAVQQTLASIDELSRERATVFQRLRDAREREIVTRAHRPYAGSLASIARQIQTENPQHGWIRDYVSPAADDECPLSGLEAVELLGLLRDERLVRDFDQASCELLATNSTPSADQLASMVAEEGLARSRSEALLSATSHPAYKALLKAPEATRRTVYARIHQLGRWAGDLEHHSADLARLALTDIRAGRGSTWFNRAAVVRELCGQAMPLVGELGHTTEVVVRGGDLSVHRHQAQELLPVLQTGHFIKRAPDGSPKLGMFSPRPVKAAAPLFFGVTVDGLPPTTTSQVTRFLLWAQITELLSALDRAWPATVQIPEEDTAHERLDWHRAELDRLELLLRFGSEIEATKRELSSVGLPSPDWVQLSDIQAYASAVEAAAAEQALWISRQPLEDLVASTRRFAESRSAAHVVSDLSKAVGQRDVAEYRRCKDRLVDLHESRRLIARRRQLATQLRARAPRLASAIEESAADSVWSGRIPNLEAAWRWAATAAWVVKQQQVDVNALQHTLDQVEAKIRTKIESLAATRAWSHAVAPERLTGTARADLTQYAQLVRRLGRGTGKYAAAQRTEIREALNRCGSAVPVWIMPIYRIAEQLTVSESMFDVVVVDEASQAGMEAAFLQYLAPKIVVIGDDKQVSPAAVGVDRQQLRDLADHYLRDDRYRASWLDPERSLFDEAKMRYGSLITLVEHRRCVPEIIGFSNRIAYEPEGIRLIPVRQYGSDRLEPIMPVHVADGYELGGTGNKVNKPEIDAIVDQIEKCIVDPRYDGLTFGVISLLGAAQARRIEARLLERVPPEEWAARDLRCGDAADFQGSERDVMFLSMVAAPSDRRLPALTRDLYVQRYNVAASRAKDQLWLFHSLQLRDVVNGDDMRYQLLDYCYGVAQRQRSGADGALVGPVPDDVRVDPFDSLFEQRVFNRISDHGYRVVPQFSTDSYRIDLVVIGARARLAIECDGDRWHGPEQYAADLARQRDLERSGWHFFRIRESEYYVDTPGVLKRLWEKLDSLEIRASDAEEVADSPEVVAEAEVPVLDQLDEELVELVAQTPPTTDEVEADAERPVTVASEASAEIPREGTPPTEPGPADALPPYHVYWGELAHPVEATSSDVMRGLIDVVAVEGPVSRQRLMTAYVRSSEAQRAGRIIVDRLAQALGKAVRSGHILAEGRGAGVTYRLPDQPTVRRRQLGPRLYSEVPMSELAALLADAEQAMRTSDPEQCSREVLARMGVHRLSSEARRVLARAMEERRPH